MEEKKELNPEMENEEKDMTTAEPEKTKEAEPEAADAGEDGKETSGDAESDNTAAKDAKNGEADSESEPGSSTCTLAKRLDAP